MSSLAKATSTAGTLQPEAAQDVARLLAPDLPRKYEIADIVRLMTTHAQGDGNSRERNGALYTIYACLANADRLVRRPNDVNLLGTVVAFSAGCLSHQPPSADLRLMNEAALAVLDLLSSHFGQSLDAHLLTRIVSFDDTEAPWSSTTCQHLAGNIVNRQLDPQSKANFVVHTVLDDVVRQKMSRVPSQRLTSGGRKRDYDNSSSEHTQNPPPFWEVSWKEDGAGLVSTFRWAVTESDSALIERNWPLYMPLLLGLLDDFECGNRVRGLEIATTFIQRCPPKILRERGIGKLLQDAIVPTLHFLPSLTPEEESVKLLSPAFDALIRLARTQHSGDKSQASKHRLLHYLLREGILAGYAHASKYIRVVQALVSQVAVIVNDLGIHATKQLKDLIPMCASIFMDPFLVRHPTLLAAASKALEAIILNCWPRISTTYTGGITRAISVCWINIADAGNGDISEKARQEVKGSLRSLAALVSSLASLKPQDAKSVSIDALEFLVQQHDDLKGLFQAKGGTADS